MRFAITSLRWAEILARSGGTGAGTTSFLDAKGAAFDQLVLKTLLSGVGLVGSDHLDETEAARLLSVGIAHDLALFDLAVLFKEARNLRLGQSRVDTGDEKVGAWVDGSIIVSAAHVVLGAATGDAVSYCGNANR